MGIEVAPSGASKPAQKRVCHHLGQRAGGESRNGPIDVPRLGRPAARVDLHARVEGDLAVESAQSGRGERGKRLAKASPELAAGIAGDIAGGAAAGYHDVVDVVVDLVNAESADRERACARGAREHVDVGEVIELLEDVLLTRSQVYRQAGGVDPEFPAAAEQESCCRECAEADVGVA